MKVINIKEMEKWNEIIKSFKNWDIYFLAEYAKSFEIKGDGVPELIYFEYLDTRLCFVVVRSDVSNFSVFKGELDSDKYFDYSTPYGYGGPLVEGIISTDVKNLFLTEFSAMCKEKNIISHFLRFHPLLENNIFFEGIYDTYHIKNTVTVNVEVEEDIMPNMDSKCRNMIRKAKKNEVNIEIDNGQRIDEFIEVYNQTMIQNSASDYYYFEKEYYNYIIEKMKDNLIFMYAIYKGKMIGGSLFFYNDKYIHYHLSGLLNQYRYLGSMNLLLYEASLWASKRGIKAFHLGGGVGIEDGLYKFKKTFNKLGDTPFYIGSKIYSEEKYNYLVHFRKQINPDFDENSNVLIKYRKV